MLGSDAFVDPRRCGGTLWDRIDEHDWERYCQGHLVPHPWASLWCRSPTGTPVSVQAGSLESIICVCANYGQRQRIQRLVRDPRLDDADIHPAARADICIYLQDRHGLAAVLLRSAAARLYVCSLNPSHSDLDLVEWAQDFCIAIETQAASSPALPLPLNLKETL